MPEKTDRNKSSRLGRTEKRVIWVSVLGTLFLFAAHIVAEAAGYSRVAGAIFYLYAFVPVLWVWLPMWLAGRQDGWGPLRRPLDTSDVD